MKFLPSIVNICPLDKFKVRSSGHIIYTRQYESRHMMLCVSAPCSLIWAWVEELVTAGTPAVFDAENAKYFIALCRVGSDQEKFLPLHVPSGAGPDCLQTAGQGGAQQPRVAQPGHHWGRRGGRGRRGGGEELGLLRGEQEEGRDQPGVGV